MSAVKAKDSSITVTGVRKDPDGSNDVLGTKDGANVMYDVSADPTTVMLPPPLVVVPVGQLAALTGFVVAASTVAIGATLVRITRQAGAALLREP